MLKRNTTITIVFLAALVVAGGCSDHTIVDPPPDETPGLPFPDTPDKLMQNFQTVYETMDLAELTRLMDSAFVTFLQQSTINNYPDVGPTLDVQEETRLHERMFSKQDVTDPEGSLMPAIWDISFQTFARQGPWGESLPSDPIPNTTCARYDVVFLFDRGPIHSTLKVQGAVKFYVTHRDSVVSGVTKPYYQMSGQLDQTLDQLGKGVESVAWGTIKAIFR